MLYRKHTAATLYLNIDNNTYERNARSANHIALKPQLRAHVSILKGRKCN